MFKPVVWAIPFTVIATHPAFAQLTATQIELRAQRDAMCKSAPESQELGGLCYRFEKAKYPRLRDVIIINWCRTNSNGCKK